MTSALVMFPLGVIQPVILGCASALGTVPLIAIAAIANNVILATNSAVRRPCLRVISAPFISQLGAFPEPLIIVGLTGFLFCANLPLARFLDIFAYQLRLFALFQKF